MQNTIFMSARNSIFKGRVKKEENLAEKLPALIKIYFGCGIFPLLSRANYLMFRIYQNLSYLRFSFQKISPALYHN